MPALKSIEEISLETPEKRPASGGNSAKVETGRAHIRVGVDGLSWDEARRLRDWLTRAIDDEPGSLEPDYV